VQRREETGRLRRHRLLLLQAKQRSQEQQAKLALNYQNLKQHYQWAKDYQNLKRILKRPQRQERRKVAKLA
jgi:hypothetical protein